MGLTTGHVFSDGDTVTAAKLNAMVNDATISADTITSSMLTDDIIESRHIADGAITSAHISSGAVSLGVISSEASSPGTMIQSGDGGAWEELSPGTAGMLLTSNGADSSLTFGLLGSSSLSNTLISGLTEHTDPIPSDLVLVKDTVAGINKHSTVQSILESFSGLGVLDANDISDDDSLLVYDKDVATAKRIDVSELRESVFNIPSLTQLNQSTIADNDDLVVYDTDAGVVKRISKSDLSTGGSMLEAQVVLEAASSSGFAFTNTITAEPASTDSGVLIVYALYQTGTTYPVVSSTLTVTLPDAGPYLNEGIKKLEFLIHNVGATIKVNSTDSSGNTVLNHISGVGQSITAGQVVSCRPFVWGSSHYWTVSVL